MFGRKKDAHLDDEDVRIVDLDRKNELRTPPTPHSPLAPRFSIRQRYIQLILTICLVALTLFILIFSIAPARNEIAGLVFHNYPTTSSSRMTNYFYVSGSPRWGNCILMVSSLFIHQMRHRIHRGQLPIACIVLASSLQQTHSHTNTGLICRSRMPMSNNLRHRIRR